ncbi:MAG: arginine decarboxylase, pyruvoyl-dependent [bacterium]|nr:arginine decarboxylase, pyruvoyl-dependent [bacterium]
MNLFKPTKFFFVAGNAEGFSKLNSFDCALLNAKIGNMNLIKISSIIPPHCAPVKFIKLPLGSFIPVAYAAITSDMTGEYIAAGVAAAHPDDPSKAGVIMEYSSNGRKKDIESIVRSMAEEAMKVRGIKHYTLNSRAIEHKVKHIGTSFAAVVLWD